MTHHDRDEKTSHDPSTALIHHGYRPPASWDAVPPGVFKASTVIFPDLAALRSRNWKSKDGYTYGLHGTPTTFTLQERLATLEGGTHCLLAPSGLAAIALVDLALLRPGDEVLLPSNVYAPSRELARTTLAEFGVTHRLYDPMEPADLARKISDHTRLVWIEAAGSVTLEFPDLQGLIAVARARGVLTALDNTWGAGIAFRPFELGLDIVMHALTKYPSGGADVLMGSVVTRDESLHHRLLQAHMRLGLGLGANDVEMVLRSLPSMAVRYHAHDAAARQLACFLARQACVSRVLHPAVPGSPGHAHWAGCCTAAAGLFSILLDAKYSAAQVDGFIERLRLFKLGYSWGGPMSLVVPYDLAAMRDTPGELTGHLVRFSVGLETVADLQSDLEQALATLG